MFERRDAEAAFLHHRGSDLQRALAHDRSARRAAAHSEEVATHRVEKAARGKASLRETD